MAGDMAISLVSDMEWKRHMHSKDEMLQLLNKMFVIYEMEFQNTSYKHKFCL